eukprot:2669524-Amphidinium_carterae.2
MRNPNNWSVEINTPPVVLDNGKTEDREDVRFKIGIEAIYSLYPQDGVPTGTNPHHYVNYYVSWHHRKGDESEGLQREKVALC